MNLKCHGVAHAKKTLAFQTIAGSFPDFSDDGGNRREDPSACAEFGAEKVVDAKIGLGRRGKRRKAASTRSASGGEKERNGSVAFQRRRGDQLARKQM